MSIWYFQVKDVRVIPNDYEYLVCDGCFKIEKKSYNLEDGVWRLKSNQRIL